MRRKYTSTLFKLLYFGLHHIIWTYIPIPSSIPGNLLLGKELILSYRITLWLNFIQATFFFFCYLWNHSFCPWNIILSILEKVGVEKHFWGQKIIPVFLRTVDVDSHLLHLWELALAWMLGGHLSPRRTTLHRATLCSIQSSLLWSFSDCIMSFTGFSARIQKRLKLSGARLSSSSSPLPQTKETNKTNSLFVVFCFLYQTMEPPSTQVLSTCVSILASRSVQMLCPQPLPTWPSLYTRFIPLFPLHFSSDVTPAGKCSWNLTTKAVSLPVCSYNTVLSLSQQLWRLSLL